VNKMNRRNNNRRKINKNETAKKPMRCNYSQRIIWDNENCKNFIIKDNSLNQEICKNCKHSF
jgi:hypothetical protein